MSKPKPDRVKRARFRSRESTRVSGGWEATPFTREHTYPPYSHSGSPYVASRRECRDWINKKIRDDGSLEPSSLDLQFKRPAICFVRGENARHIVKGLYSGSIYNSTSLQGPEWSQDKGDEAYAIELLAQTSPFRSTVSVPEMISDLVDVTKLIRINAKSLATLAGSIELTNDFVIQPFRQDVHNLNRMVELIESRIREFDSLFKKGGLRRRKQLDNYSMTPKTSDERTLYSSSFGFSRGTVTETGSTKVWGSCRWRPKEDLKYSAEDFKDWKYQVRLFLDLEAPDLETAWEVIPFSWLIDYFTNIGDIFKSLNGREFVEPYDICIMRHRTVSGSVNVTYEYGLKHHPDGKAISEGKFRSVVYETLPDLSTFALKWPTWSQLGNILALLATMKGGGIIPISRYIPTK